MAIDIISKEDAKYKIDSGESVLIIDARTEEVYTEDSDQIEGALHIPQNIMKEIYTELPKNREYLVYSNLENPEISRQFADFLKEKGFTAYSISGGFEEWRDSGFPIEPINAKGTPLE